VCFLKLLKALQAGWTNMLAAALYGTHINNASFESLITR
jgi:hypothetical protein